MSVDYAAIVRSLMQSESSILAIAIIDNSSNIVYTTDNWDISAEVKMISSGWVTQKLPAITISGVKYMTLQVSEIDLVATNITGQGHIVGVKDEQIKVIAYIQPEGDMKGAIVELTRGLRAMGSKGTYLDVGAKLGKELPAYQGKAATEGTSTSVSAPVSNASPELKAEIQAFLDWIKDSDGLPGYINYYIQQNDAQKISELSKIYFELRKIFGV